ncbi:MAG: polysulfide reductase NrfD [Deltaproteobacteria bacterium]|jgi:molybdopterin-containing oxidoreductase family membrane subunit|nr:polysulfide reductase NrfD [Deltaproteobacteria bacterium]
MKINYNLPIDADMFPTGRPRCTLTEFFMWLAPFGLLMLFGLVAAFLVFKDGLGWTALDDYFGFGLWIGFDLAIIALGAGAFFTGLLRYILNIEPLKNIINLAVIIGFICYTGAMMVLVLDIGQPIRAWFGFWHANVHSMLTEVIFCLSCYCIVLAIEYVPLVLEQRQLNRIPILRHLAHNMHLLMPLFAGVGAFLSTFHQGSLGGMFGVMIGRPFAFREGFFIWPWTFFLFTLSAIASGPMLTVLVASLMEKITGRRLVSWDVKSIMGKIAGTMLLVYIVFKMLDTWWWAADMAGRAGMTFDQMFHGLGYGMWLLFVEIVICGVLPCIILLCSVTRNKPSLFYLAAILDCIGISINRYIISVQTLAQPVLPFDSWELYIPNWVEWAPSIMVIAYGVILLSLSYRYLPLFPQEDKLNSGL